MERRPYIFRGLRNFLCDQLPGPREGWHRMVLGPGNQVPLPWVSGCLRPLPGKTLKAKTGALKGTRKQVAAHRWLGAARCALTGQLSV